MMLARFWVWTKAIADAHHAGMFPGFGQRPVSAADTHDTGPAPEFGRRALQLMLMMLAWFQGFGKGHCS